MRIALILIALTYNMTTVFAQSSDISFKVHDVMDMFGAKQKGVWISHFAGISSEGDSYVFTLGHDTHEFKGILQNISRNEHFNVEGNYHVQQIKLVLQDSSHELLGFLAGDMNTSGLWVRILNRRKEKGCYIEFERVNRDGFKILECPASVWYQSFNGFMDQSAVFIQLQKEKDKRIYGTVSMPSKLTGYLVSGNCEDPQCKKINLNLHDFFGERFKEYKVTKEEEKVLKAEEFYKDKFTIYENWNQLDNHTFECKNLSLPVIRLYAQYVQIDDKDFDLWIEEFITRWTDQVISFYQPGDMQEQKDATANMDIDWISSDWVSGILKFTEPWSDVERSMPFTFDRRLNRIISLDELFDKDFDYKSYFAEYIAAKKKEMIRKNNSNRFKAYLDLDFFSHWTLRPEGFCFTSEFNSVWGTRKIIIPYAALQTHIRKSGPLKKLF